MTRVIIILGFLLSFGAGFYTGTHWVHHEGSDQSKISSTRPNKRLGGGLLQADLNLTPDQQKEMTEIWSDVSGPGQRAYSEKQRQASKDHYDDILKVLSPATIEQIEKIDRKFLDRMEGIDLEWRKSYEEAVEKTRKMLNPDQLARYNQILNARFSGPDGRGGNRGGRDGGGRDGGGRDGGWREGQGASSRPSTRPNGLGFGGGQFNRQGPFLSIPTTRPAN
jgi:hypothetical protein